ncbi:MAG: MFS transporter [Desulfurococcales archaeon]|nr:MFS transporter [Desulfurococcales archaeon]
MEDGNRVKTAVYGVPVFAYMYTIGSVGFWLPLYVKLHGFSYLEVQLLATVYFIILTPSTVIAGWLTDKTGRPSIIASTGMLLNAASILLMAHIVEPLPLMAVRVVQALGLSAAIPVALGALSLALGVSQGVGSNAFIMASGMSLGSVLGGLIIEYLGFKPMFYSAAAISLIAALISHATDYPRVQSRIDFSEALRRIPASVWLVLAGLVGRNTLATGVYSILAILFNQILGLSLVETALALAVNPIVQSLASLYIPKRVEGRELALYSLGISSTAIVFMLYYITDNIATAAIAQTVQGLTYALINISGNVYIISRTPSEIRYTASSLYGFAFNLGWVLGTLAAGAFMQRYGPIAWLKLAIALLPLIGLATYVAGRRAERGLAHIA